MVELNAEAQKQLADMFVTMANNPKTRAQTVKLAKEAGITLNLPDVEAATIREEMEAKLAERDQKEEQRRIKEKMERQRMSLIEKGFTDEDVGKIEKEVMEKHGISDYEVAAKIYAADTKPAPATPEIHSGVWEMPAFPKEMLSNPRNYARKEAFKVIDELRTKKTA